jgi:SAM-dependent methyltransferase
MTTTDPFAQFKSMQREGWALFTPVEGLTTPAAAKLVNFAGVKPSEKVVDLACGTGVVAVTAALRGATVKALDLSPVLLERARFNASVAKVNIDFTEGDVEALPYKDGEFDVVLSQFGHMFAPRPEVAIKEMLRILKPGGRIAFSTWPPELFTGRMFALTAKYLPPPPEGAAPPPQWGNPQIVRERLGDKVKDLSFEREMLTPPVLSPAHFRTFIEGTVAPLLKLRETTKDKPEVMNNFNKEFEALIAEYTHDNQLRQHFLITKATKI